MLKRGAILLGFVVLASMLYQNGSEGHVTSGPGLVGCVLGLFTPFLLKALNAQAIILLSKDYVITTHTLHIDSFCGPKPIPVDSRRRSNLSADAQHLCACSPQRFAEPPLGDDCDHLHWYLRRFRHDVRLHAWNDTRNCAYYV